jgi:hypothetical protein
MCCMSVYVCVYHVYMYAHLVEQGGIEGGLSGCGKKHEYFEIEVFLFPHSHVVLQELNQDSHLLIQRDGQIPLRHLVVSIPRS